MGALRWDELTREELRAVLGRALVILPTGATEQHGPHLPTGHDAFAVEAMARQAAAAAAERVQEPLVLAPTLPFGSSAHHLPFGGTLSLRTATYGQVVRDLLESAIDSGARRLFLLNGHGGNHELNQLAARDVARERPVAIAAASYWDIAERGLHELSEMSQVRLPGHAGMFETATHLALRPGSIHQLPERTGDPSAGDAIDGVRIERHGAWQAFDGWTDSPARATTALGEAALAIIVRDVAAAFVRFLAMTADLDAQGTE